MININVQNKENTNQNTITNTHTFTNINLHLSIKCSNKIWSILELTDKRIACGCGPIQPGNPNSIIIYSIDFNTNTYKEENRKDNAHLNHIISMCECSPNKLFSLSTNEIKIWNTTTLTLLHTINDHLHPIYKVIILNNNKFVSCSSDKTIRIWNSTTYQSIFTITETAAVFSMLNINNEILIGNVFEHYLSVYDLLSYQRITIIQGIYTVNHNGMVLLSNNKFAVSQYYSNCIVIINVITFEIETVIEDKEYISKYSGCLSVFDEDSFIYVYNGLLVHIVRGCNGKYKINYKVKEDSKIMDGYYGLLCIHRENEKYLIIGNDDTEINIFKPE